MALAVPLASATLAQRLRRVLPVLLPQPKAPLLPIQPSRMEGRRPQVVPRVALLQLSPLREALPLVLQLLPAEAPELNLVLLYEFILDWPWVVLFSFLTRIKHQILGDEKVTGG